MNYNNLEAEFHSVLFFFFLKCESKKKKKPTNFFLLAQKPALPPLLSYFKAKEAFVSSFWAGEISVVL